jgi:hypothetical protein
MASKKKSQRDHFQKRSIQRIGSFIQKSEIERIINEIKANKTIHIGRLSNRVSAHGIEISGETVIVLYDKIRKELITVLPKEHYLYKKIK